MGGYRGMSRYWNEYGTSQKHKVRIQLQFSKEFVV